MTGSALTSMWAWDNPVLPSADARGRAYEPASVSSLVAFCTSRGLTRVFLSAPWAADEGPVGDWFAAACSTLHDASVQVSPLGGDPGWLGQPSLAVTWALAAARSAALPDGVTVQLDVEPWTTPAWTSSRALVVDQWLALLALVGSSVAIGVDLPWWLAHERYRDGTVLDAVLPLVSRVAVVAFADHAGGPSGVVSLAGPAVVAASAAGLPFTVGVETDTAQVAGGPQYTFASAGPAALEAETMVVRDAFGELPGYEGVTVEHHRAWRRLLALDPPS
ncbi:hypothetical protein ACPPVS_17135 [Cellulomonas sp. McL0617]|uniref:hypothetical protein n=1 Tax=Cellulomonas sp. McL0617 TaxID=3415675 RepID=UPI003CFB8DD8